MTQLLCPRYRPEERKERHSPDSPHRSNHRSPDLPRHSGNKSPSSLQSGSASVALPPEPARLSPNPAQAHLAGKRADRKDRSGKADRTQSASHQSSPHSLHTLRKSRGSSGRVFGSPPAKGD